VHEAVRGSLSACVGVSGRSQQKDLARGGSMDTEMGPSERDRESRQARGRWEGEELRFLVVMGTLWQIHERAPQARPCCTGVMGLDRGSQGAKHHGSLCSQDGEKPSYPTRGTARRAVILKEQKEGRSHPTPGGSQIGRG